jgi:hypothetical protein
LDQAEQKYEIEYNRNRGRDGSKGEGELSLASVGSLAGGTIEKENITSITLSLN